MSNLLASQILQALKELQEIDCRIFEMEKTCQAKPQSLNNKKEQMARSKQQLEKAKEEVKKIKLEISKKELDLKSLEEKMTKMEQQLNTVKTNKEYSTLQNEINGVKADRSVIEDGILEFLNQNEVLQKKVNACEAEVARYSKEIEDMSGAIAKEVEQIKNQLGEICQIRQKNTCTIEKDVMENYERILKNKSNRVALAKVIHNTCQGCHMDITPQQVNELLKGKQIVYCRSCMRILYIPKSDSDTSAV